MKQQKSSSMRTITQKSCSQTPVWEQDLTPVWEQDLLVVLAKSF
jgi:hypothetical protein